MEVELKKLGTRDLCPVAIVIRDGLILLGLRHYTKDKWKNISVWTVPGGKCDEGENLETTLRREVSEETGITDLEIQEYWGNIPGAKEGDVVPLFLCTTKSEPILMEPDKFSEWSWFPVNKIPSNFINEEARKVILEKYLK